MPPKRPTYNDSKRGFSRPAGRGQGDKKFTKKAPFHKPAGAERGAASASPLQLKKAKAKFHQDKFKKEREAGRTYGGRGGGSRGGMAGAVRDGRGGVPISAKSHRTTDVDIHLAAKVARDLRQDISQFKSRSNGSDLFDARLNELFCFVSPTFIQQHLPDDVSAFKTYLSKFRRGAPNDVSAFTQWYEWANFEVNKGKSFSSKKEGDVAEEQDDNEAGAAVSDGKSAQANGAEEKTRKKSKSREVMAQTLKEREHARALLQMCVRHNASRRKEGQHALVNHLKAKLIDADCGSLEKLRSTAHHSVVFTLSRLILGMATEDLAMIVLHCHALYLVLTSTPITASVILSLMDEELALSARMTAAKLRLDSKRAGAAAGDPGEDADVEDVVDPDDINDPTKGERNQRLTAAVFALAAVVAATGNGLSCSRIDATTLSTYLSFCYVQQKATRILSANVLFLNMKAHPGLLADEEAMTWATFAFFYYPKMEYFRPEAVQFLLRLMVTEHKQELAQACLPGTVVKYMETDPLEPATLEQLVNALFRKEQVTAAHPMVHPVWNDFFNLILERCAMGESLKEHLTTFVHSAIAPYRRGNADVPRRALFQNLVTRLGQIAVQSEDSEERTELLHMASKNAGYGARTSAKPTPLADLKHLTVDALTAKIDDLLRQYRATKDRDPAAHTNRTWVLRELRNCLSVPVPTGIVACPYVNTTVMALLEQAFFPSGTSTDELSKNRCVYLFSDVFSFTYQAAKSRPKATVAGIEIIGAYLEAEGKGKSRFRTALQNKKFLKARNRIVEVLEKVKERSVLFYDFRDMEILLTMLFLILSVDDPSNSEALTLATDVVPDLVQFCTAGSLETVDMLFDVLMALIMRTSAPLQVMPMVTCVRRLATGFILKFAPHVKTKYALDIVLSPLREAYHTDSREIARLRKAKEEGAKDADDSDDESANGEAEGENEEGASDADDASSSSSSEVDDESSEGDEDSVGGEDSTAPGGSDGDDDSTDKDDDAGSDVSELAGAEDDEDALSVDEEEAPTQQFVDALKGMVGNADLDHAYPVDTSNKEKSDLVRAVQLAARFGVMLTSPIVVHVYQVLLAVARETVKSSDDVVFNAALSGLEMLFLSKNRYFGYFLPATDLFQLLGDIQSYSRKLEKSLFAKENVPARVAAAARVRFQKLKATAVRVIHFLATLAYKNNAGEEVRITTAEFYKSIFCDRGWDMKRLLPGLKKDLYHYRQGFAWALIPAVFEKFADIAEINGAQRVRVFSGCCTMIESMMSRFPGLPSELKTSTRKSICDFLQSLSVEQVYGMKHTLPHTFLHTVKMVLQYNSRVQLDERWVATEVVAKAIDDDDIQLSGASVRLLASMERMLHLTPRARETKPPVPVKVLFQQFEKTGAKEKGDFYRKNKRAREKVVKALLAYRNDDPTDEERAVKRRRREELKVEDRLQRQVMRESSATVLTKEEREEKRKKILMAKQERIAKNRDRKRRLHEARQRSFDRWRQSKLATAAAAAEAAEADDE